MGEKALDTFRSLTGSQMGSKRSWKRSEHDSVPGVAGLRRSTGF